MNEERNNNFWADVFKWFLIWNILSLLVRGFVFVCKVMFVAISQLVYLIAIGIKKIIHILKVKWEQFKIDYAQKYKPQIDYKIYQIKQNFSNMQFNFKNKIKALKIKCKNYSENRIRIKEEKKIMKSFNKIQKQKIRKESELALKIKKAKYWINDFFYTYEFQILILGILGVGIIITLIILNIIK